MLTIRHEQAPDRVGIHAVHVACFPSAGEARVVDALRAQSVLSLSLVAEDEKMIVGHVAFSPVTLAGARGGVGLGPLAVMPNARRQGIAAKLVREGIARSCLLELEFVVVLGDPSYYQRFGFRPASAWGLSDEYAGGDAFQALELVSDSIPPGGGVVRYQPAFSVFGV